jgi:hypothetical protein
MDLYRGRGKFECRQWDGSPSYKWQEWLGKAFRGFHGDDQADDQASLKFVRPSLGLCAALPGYWIIRYGEGEFQAVPDSTFHKYYEAVGT